MEHPKIRVLPPSRAPQLGRDEDSNVRSMVEWFHGNFADPIDILYWNEQAGDYYWGRKIGPFLAATELSLAFRGAGMSDEIEEARKQIETGGVTAWTLAPHRIISPSNDAPDMARARIYDGDTDQHRDVVVETILYPIRDMDWTVHFTFVPGDSNRELGEELEGPGAPKQRRQRFRSIRAMVIFLLSKERNRLGGVDKGIPEAGISWVKSLQFDTELFTQDAIVIHNSPPQWLDLRSLGPPADGAAVTAIVLSSSSFEQGTLLMLAYGGSRVFIRLVRNLNGLQDALFERVQRRIRRGDWKPSTAEEKSGKKRRPRRRSKTAKAKSAKKARSAGA